MSDDLGSQTPVLGLTQLIQDMVVPMLRSQEHPAIPDCEQTAKKFSQALQQAVEASQGGITMRKPDSNFVVELKQSVFHSTAEKEEYVRHYESVMDDWCLTVEAVLSENEHQRKEPDDVGPDTEIEYWRTRMAKINSIAKDLKSSECKCVLGVLQVADSQTLARWKQLDNAITDAANEAKDNTKYLTRLEKYTKVLYDGTPLRIIEGLPALMDNVKMMYSIARYYNTPERMTTLFIKITNQMIANCKRYILGLGRLWDQNPTVLVERLHHCLKLNEAYQEQYRLTKDKLQSQPKGKQFDFSENHIFGKFDLFCKRVQKLIDMFSTTQQFSSLANHNIEGMDQLIKNFFSIVDDFKRKPYDLLDYYKNQFDRDYLEFNVSIHELETALQGFINQSFESITSTEHALNLLKQFQAILQRDNLKADLDSKYMVIFHNYGLDLETVQKIYEKHKNSPPMVRNAPPVAGNIIWARQLLRRIEEPMMKFQSNKNIMKTKESKKIIRTYNKVARALIEFETLWHYAWTKSIETAKTGLQATLIIRHPDNGRLLVNFDREILQLIKETKWMQRLEGLEVPDGARLVLLQEQKFKSYYNQLQFVLKEYDRVVANVLPVVRPLLRAHLDDLDSRIEPGLVALTWTSMNIDTYLSRIHQGLSRIEDLVTKINDIVDNRIEANLKVVSRMMLVDLPADQSFALDNFVSMQEKLIRNKASVMDQKNLEVERAVKDLVDLILSSCEPDEELLGEAEKVTKHYNRLMYKAILNATKSSFNALKKRVGSRATGGFLFMERPFFDVDVELQIPNVVMNPSLEEIQHAINRAAMAILKCSKKLWNWGIDRNNIPEDIDRNTFFFAIAADKEIVKVILLLTGSIEGTKKQVMEYLETFRMYDYLWKDDMQAKYAEFMKGKPDLDDFEAELRKYMQVEQEIEAIPPVHNIGALSLETQPLKQALKGEANAWKEQYAKNLHVQAKDELFGIVDYIKETSVSLNHPINDLEDVRVVMNVLKEVRERESEVDIQFTPVEEQYGLLGRYDVKVPKDETDTVSELRYSWKRLRNQANGVNEKLAQLQSGFKKDLINSVKVFVGDVAEFRRAFEINGPMVQGIKPQEAVERLRRFQREFEQRKRKWQTYAGGEELFGLPQTEYPELVQTEKELKLLDKLYSLYTDVITTINGFADIAWVDVVSNIEQMSDQVNSYQNQCKRLPRGLRDWEAFHELKKTIDDFLEILPHLQALSSPAMRPRHWQQIMDVTGKELKVDSDQFKLSHILEAQLLRVAEDVEEITNAAVKEEQIEQKMASITSDWEDQIFTFNSYKNRGPVILKGVPDIMEKLEETQMTLGSISSSRYVVPFKVQVTEWVNKMSTVSEMIEQWLVVQNMWTYMEAVFASGDIKRQLPQEAKKFDSVDKKYMQIMAKAFETQNVIQCCYGNDLLKNLLPHLTEQLEQIQKSLTGYLETKRNLFPRFYFVSDPVLLEILSQGSDPQAIQPHLNSVFDSIGQIAFDRIDKNKVVSMSSPEGESVPLYDPFLAHGNIEDWLAKLEASMKSTIKDIIRSASGDYQDCALKEFIDRYPAQVVLLGIQFMWTEDCEKALTDAKTNKQIFSIIDKKIGGVLKELVDITTGDIEGMDRVKVETLITIQVHQRDVFDDLKRNKVKDVTDFDWTKQCRFYWRPELCDDEGDTIISIADVDFEYCNEYLGCKERLVITPLTDRCYITLSQALGMFLGGAPAGPAGTGKTETTKDMGRSLGKWVVVFNCSDQMDYRAMGKIYKGLCQSGAWGCFDEFNRIDLEVLSVVAQQVLCILTAMRERQKQFVFTDGINCKLDARTGFFITMNPGYAGRQELPENLKTLFRGVAMMVPDRRIIMKVKLAAAGYQMNEILSKKFNVLYHLCEQQLSKQTHYDFGLRNILSVLRTAGATKRTNLDKPEDLLLMRTLRDMNLSKFVAEDVPLFLSLIKDLFPGITAEKARYMKVEEAIQNQVKEAGLQFHGPWVEKVIQLYETSLVRHGIMVVGPAGAGKTRIYDILLRSLTECGIPHKEMRMNPKAITAPQMFGRLDVATNDWTDGIFSALWRKATKVKNQNVWIILDGPVDAIWIENLNTVLDDNKLLTLANGDRIQMTSNMKACFEPENLMNASPATVSRAGIIYVSDTVLDWRPCVESWCDLRKPDEAKIIRQLFDTFGDDTFYFLKRETNQVMFVPRVRMTQTTCEMMGLILKKISESGTRLDEALYERVFLYCWCWSLGGLLESKDRIKFSEYVSSKSTEVPSLGDETLYEFFVDQETGKWQHWSTVIPAYEYSPEQKFSQTFVPTLDSTRYESLMQLCYDQNKNVLIVGDSGTSKTATINSFFNRFDSDHVLNKQINFSSYTTPEIFQRTIESVIEKRQGRTFGPPGGKRMCCFIDDIAMPEINTWGDQITNEIVRQLLAEEGFYNLEKPGEFKNVVDVLFFGGMNHPGGGKNDVPNRLKRQFSCFNMTLPGRASIDNIYGAILRGRFNTRDFSADVCDVAGRLTDATIMLWEKVKAKMLPTPAKFHYIFNMRDLSRVFQGVLLPPNEVVKDEILLLRLWKHEAERVFSDKLVSLEDKAWFGTCLTELIRDKFGDSLMVKSRDPMYWVDFLREPVYDDEGVLIDEHPKVYEPADSLEHLRGVLEEKMQSFNEESKVMKLDLVLFDDAIRHLVRISRIIDMPRGSVLLVGVGGSGKQSLTRLASFISGNFTFQITITKTYNVQNLFDDLKSLYKIAGLQGHGVTFIFTDAEVKQETFLEYMNNLLATGEVPGLFPRDELDQIVGDIRGAAKKEHGSGFVDTYDNLYRYFIERTRDNLHVVLCFSPVGEKFRTRARKFPGLISNCTIDWLLPWPKEALKSVAQKFIGNFSMETDDATKMCLVDHMAFVHDDVNMATRDYLEQYRRYVYVTPKSYLSFLGLYQNLYKKKHSYVNELKKKLKTGLDKLLRAAEDVAKMKEELKVKEANLEVAQVKSNNLLMEITASRSQAEKEKQKVEGVKNACQAEADKINAYKDECEQDLMAAKPALEEAESALDAITAKDIGTVKQLKNPPEIIKRIMDTVLILLHEPISKIDIVQIKDGRFFYQDSYKSAGVAMGRSDFLDLLKSYPKDNITDEMCEILQPYLDQPDFTTEKARSASGNVAGLCSWVRGMHTYHFIAKEVQPKIEALKKAEAKLAIANRELAAAEAQLQGVLDELAKMQANFDAAMAEKQRIQDDAELTKKRMDSANALIRGLSGERTRWAAQLQEFNKEIAQLVGDCAIASAFVSYAGPFNQTFRDLLTQERFFSDCIERKVPVTDSLDLIKFLADEAEIGEWNLQGLPTDVTSTQNGILVTRSSRWPLLIDPQKQGLEWLKSREADNMLRVTTLTEKRFRDTLEDCMSYGKPMIIENVEEQIDPVLDPVLEKQIITSGRSMKICLADKDCDYNMAFQLFITTKLPNPHFSPELSAKVLVIDFTVTLQGLEDQLLGRVISKEKPELEEQRQNLLSDVNGYKKKLKQLEDDLLHRLANSQGNLLDDTELIDVLAVTKSVSDEVSEKLKDADETQRSIIETREEYRPVAIRGSVLYFLISEMSGVNCMYQTSLQQFLEVFDKSMDNAEKAPLPSRRIANIIAYLTYAVHKYVTVGLFEPHKMLWTLLMVLKIKIRMGELKISEFQTFLKGGSALNINEVRKKPFEWVPDMAWLHVVECAKTISNLKELPDLISRSEGLWKHWYDMENPETAKIPEIDERLSPFEKLLVVRCLREDRTLLAATDFISDELGQKYVDSIPLDLDYQLGESNSRCPLIFLLSQGSDPTTLIEQLAKKKKKDLKSISMGQGQEIIARRLIGAGVQTGGWVLLQNTHLGLKFLSEVENSLMKLEEIDDGFRVFITCEPHAKFPIGLLQMSIKLTNEAPAGCRAGLKRSYTWVNQDTLDIISRKDWRCLLYAMCFIHSLVQERRKFGPLGWNVPYEFNQSDLSASVQFIQNHMMAVELTKGAVISWKTIRYMVSEVQYGGRITDDFDRRLMNAYTEQYLSPKIFSDTFQFYMTNDGFSYRIPDVTEIAKFRAEIERLPLIDNPELFGLHMNADLTFRNKQTRELLDTIIETQPKSSSGGGGKSREDIVLEIADDLLSKMPPGFKKDIVKERIGAQGGMAKPLNVFLSQEVDRLQTVIAITRTTLEDLKLAIAGTIVLSEHLIEALNSLFDARVPPIWLRKSWFSPTLGLWFTGLLQRYEQLSDWLTKGRPNAFWLTGWFNAQGFLTATRQEVARKKGGWALDEVIMHTEVTKYDWDDAPRPSDDGVHVYGLFLDGAAWDKKHNQLADSQPKILFNPLPVLFVTAIQQSDKRADSNTYVCPIYTIPKRTAINFVTTVELRTTDPRDKWILRGVALLCSKDG